MDASTISRNPVGVRRPRRSLRFSRDEDLVRMLRSGDERAFEVIFDRHHRGILSFCRHMVSSREEAEDAVQHTFAAAYRDLIGSDKPIQLKAWLYTIARNRCLSILRARKEQVSLEDAEPATEGLSAEVQRRQDLRDMLADLSRLPEDQRAALVLAELGALSHDEIGVTLGVRKDKVKALVFQARESLASSRDARDADCQEIQEQLSVLRGGALRRTQLRRHIEICPACAAFKAEVQRQRTAMACLLPVAPSAFLRDSVMAAVFGGGAAGGAGLIGGGGGGLLAAAGAKGLAAKIATIAVVAGGATGGGLLAVDELSTAPADGSGQAIAAVPEERQSVELVSTLRERAQRAAEQRRADAAASSSQGSEPASQPGGGAKPASNPSGGADRKARKPRRRGTSRADSPRPDATPAPSVAAAVPATETGGSGKAKKDKGSPPHGKAKGHATAPGQLKKNAGEQKAVEVKPGAKLKPKAKSKPAKITPPATPPAGQGNGHDKARGNGHAKHGDENAAPRAAPAPPEGGEQGNGNPKKEKLLTELLALPTAVLQEEVQIPADVPLPEGDLVPPGILPGLPAAQPTG
jgi:RNA polymerase sigma factor (sigma-70 family)